MIANNSQAMAGYPAGSLSDSRSSATGIQTVSTGEVFRMGARQLTSILRQLPNPAYYMTKLPGQILPAVLLLTRGVVAEGRTMPLTAAVQQTQSVLNGSIGVPDASPVVTGHRATMTAGMAPNSFEYKANGTSTADHGLQGDEATADHGLQGDEADRSKPKWATVPLPDSLDRPIGVDELTADKEFVRTGFAADDAVTQRQVDKGGAFYGPGKSTLYRFALKGLTLNQVEQLPCKKLSGFTGNDHRGSSMQQVKCSDVDIKVSPRYDMELSNCFHMSWSSPADDKGLLKSSGLYLGDCPAALSSKRISGAMYIQIPRAEPATIFQIHSIPDRLLYRDTAGATGLLSKQSSGATYNSLLADGMRFEPETPAPFSIGIEKGEGTQRYLAIKGRSDYGRYTDGDCSVSFNATNLAVDQARCCHDQQQDTTYLHAELLDHFHSDWFNVRYEIKFSDYDRFTVRPGRVKVWVDEDMVVNAKLFIGGNDDVDRGGGGYYATFGISDLRSYEPIVVKFRDVEFYSGIQRNPPDSDTKPLTTVTGQCNVQLDWLTFCP